MSKKVFHTHYPEKVHNGCKISYCIKYLATTDTQVLKCENSM